MESRGFPPELLEVLLGQAAAGATEIAVSVYDDDGRYVAVNDCACALLGYTREEVIARDVGDFTEGGIDRSRLLRPGLREGVRLIHRKDGSSFPAQFVVSPTKVGQIAFYVSFWWRLADDDPRAVGAS